MGVRNKCLFIFFPVLKSGEDTEEKGLFFDKKNRLIFENKLKRSRNIVFGLPMDCVGICVRCTERLASGVHSNVQIQQNTTPTQITSLHLSAKAERSLPSITWQCNARPGGQPRGSACGGSACGRGSTMTHDSLRPSPLHRARPKTHKFRSPPPRRGDFQNVCEQFRPLPTEKKRDTLPTNTKQEPSSLCVRTGGNSKTWTTSARSHNGASHLSKAHVFWVVSNVHNDDNTTARTMATVTIIPSAFTRVA